MLTPDYLRQMAERISHIAQAGEDAMLQAVIRKLLQTDIGQATSAEIIELQGTLQRLAFLYGQAGAQEIARVIAEAMQVATEGVTFTAYEQRLIEHINRTTQRTWYNLTETQAYSAVERYVRAANDAYIRVTAGGESHTKAKKDVVRELADEGITIVQNKRREHTDVAIERNLRTEIARTAGDISLERAKEEGYNLVLVSAHLGARPTHTEWQGKVYSIAGKTDKYDDFYAATGYGTMLGLCGINCRHTFSAWKEGMNNPWEDFDNEASAKRYELEQKQRELERKIRDLKRKKMEAEEEAQAFPKDHDAKEHLREAKRKLAEARKEYRDFCAENDLRELTERLDVTRGTRQANARML